jgi:hypothetical protein
MTLDASLANLQAQADRLAGHFAAISDRIEAEGARAAVVAASALAEPPARAGHWGHVHSGYAGEPELSAPIPVRQDTPVGVVAAADGSVLNFEGENYVPQTPQGAAPSGATTGVPAPGAVEVEGEAATPAVAPPPADNPFGVAPTPWDQQAAEAQAAPAPAEKKGGRRTNEEIAAEIGVDLDAVKKWKGGGRVSRADMEEFKKISDAQAMNNQTLPEAAALPTAAADPFGAGSALPAAAPVQNAMPAPEPVAAPQAAPAPQQPLPNPFESQAVTPPPAAAPMSQAPAPQFSEWGAADVDDDNPF